MGRNAAPGYSKLLKILAHATLYIINQRLGHLTKDSRCTSSHTVIIHFCFSGQVTDAAEQH